MDEMVTQALARWPNVPDCTGWLALDARGRWRIGEGDAGPRQPITHAAMNAFISRNYLSNGRFWIFQNGPQRVFVELEYTPFVWRLHPRADASWEVVAHTGTALTPSSVWLDDAGRFLMEARSASGEPLVGVVHDHDTALVADSLRDDDGGTLGDDTIARLSSSAVRESAASTEGNVQLHLRQPDAAILRLPLRRIAARQVAVHFGFEPHPSLAMRIDADTRR